MFLLPSTHIDFLSCHNTSLSEKLQRTTNLECMTLSCKRINSADKWTRTNKTYKISPTALKIQNKMRKVLEM